MVQQPSYWKVLTRRKQLSHEAGDGEGKLNRVLGLYDLTALGVGSTLGAGVYVLAGQIARDQAGPSVMLSFAIAALASLLAGICYAEFGARVPKAGSAYVYSYVCIGEFAAFVIGWNLILEYMIGTASVCRGISLYLDTLINDTLKTTFADIAPMNVTFLGSYFDFFACGLVVVFGFALAFGVETSAIANNFCTCVNLSILLFVIIAGSLKANFSNWTIDINTVNKTEIPPNADLGDGGFFPFGFTGTLKGAATCFFGFVGFDCIATTGEEVQNPRKNIPRSILLSLLVIFLCYFGVSTVLTLMVPYYLQDPNAPLPSAFKVVGWNFAMWLVSIGGLIGLMASLFGALFPLPRVMYSMAQDGLMFRFLGRIHPRYRVPVVGSIFAALLTALIAGLFDLAQLVNLLSIGTLLAYSVVAISITILRYMDNSDTFGKPPTNGTNGDALHENGQINGNGNGNGNINGNGNPYANGNGHNLSESSLLTSKGHRISFELILTQLFNFQRVHVPNELSTRIVGTLITVFCLLSLGIGLIFMQAYDALITNQLWVLVLLIVLCILTAFVLLCICLQPRELYARVFRVPLVPLVPALSIFINIYLMLQLDVMTWIRFGVWMAIGIPMFIACWCMYDIKNPANRHPDRIEFEKLLKQSSPQHAENKENPKNPEELSNTATTLILQQNECSVKSLDEIMDLKEVEDELKEVKHPNGQICYIEDNKSNKSQNSSHKNEEGRDVNNALNDTSEEEKSVIAMLDDVLQTEDDNLNDSQFMSHYDRKLSIDSEMVPSVIRSTTKATVHSSDSSSDSSEMDYKLQQKFSTKSIDSGYQEKQKVARELVDEVLNSPELWRALERHQEVKSTTLPISNKDTAISNNDSLLNSDNETTDNIIVIPNTLKSIYDSLKTDSEAEKSLNSAQRQKSVESLGSLKSIEDPLHSENFRNKLSQLILKPPEPKPSAKEQQKSEEFVYDEPRPKLKHSKSEADVRQLVLKAIEGCNIDVEDKTVANESSKGMGNNIPKPPKFDPILYKTINSLSKPKERPRLEKLLTKDNTIKQPNIVDEPAKPTQELPFKQKLEAMLKRGPSHKTQQRPKIEQKRPKSMGPLQLPESQEIVEAIQANINNSPKNLNEPSISVIEQTRKTLRPVQIKPIEL